MKASSQQQEQNGIYYIIEGKKTFRDWLITTRDVHVVWIYLQLLVS